MQKERLLTPGPTFIPQQIFHAMTAPTLHHRTAEFEAILRETQQAYARLVDSPTTPLFLACSGTGAMEASLLNLTNEGDQVLAINCGKFGERWVKLATSYGLSVAEVVGEWGSSVDQQQLEVALRSLTSLAAVFVQHCETSTAALHCLHTIKQTVSSFFPDALLVVDGITSIGVTSVSMKDYGIDALVGGSQKALMLPPGLAMVTMSDRAWEAVARCRRNRFYFHLEKERKQQEAATTAWTPAIGLILGLQESLRIIEAEGKNEVYARHALMSKVARAGLKALGFRLMAEDCVSPGLTAGFAPDGVDTGVLLKHCLKLTGVRIAGGQDHLKGKIVRMGHMGYTDVTDVLTGLVSLGRVLHKMKPEYSPEAGVAAACRELATQ